MPSPENVKLKLKRLNNTVKHVFLVFQAYSKMMSSPESVNATTTTQSTRAAASTVNALPLSAILLAMVASCNSG
jgi:hypothetical protein